MVNNQLHNYLLLVAMLQDNKKMADQQVLDVPYSK